MGSMTIAFLWRTFFILNRSASKKMAKWSGIGRCIKRGLPFTKNSLNATSNFLRGFLNKGIFKYALVTLFYSDNERAAPGDRGREPPASFARRARPYAHFGRLFL